MGGRKHLKKDGGGGVGREKKHNSSQQRGETSGENEGIPTFKSYTSPRGGEGGILTEKFR